MQYRRPIVGYSAGRVIRRYRLGIPDSRPASERSARALRRSRVGTGDVGSTERRGSSGRPTALHVPRHVADVAQRRLDELSSGKVGLQNDAGASREERASHAIVLVP